MARDRPDPDVLLRRVRQEEAQAKRGKLRIFFGFAPGVGKTYRMLNVARELSAQHNLRVIVGVVETHQRAETAALLEGLEVLPRKQIEYRGHTLSELDLDAALARKPDLLLVDELAHSNVPGSRHRKRWQDVLELLDAGVDVFTTINVQHLESLNDIVTQITGVQVRETVPDSVLDRAEAVELVDIAPEELLSRLKDGKVYLGVQAKRAVDHFFQRGNLLALRELALRRTAQHVDEDVLEYREQHGVAVTWPAGERILVCVGPSPSSGRLLRAAARMAAGLRCPWVAAYVDSSSLPLSAADRERLETHLRVVEALGGTITRLSGPRIAPALLSYARRSNVTRLVIGKPTHSRLRDRLRGSLLDEVVRGSGEIDVHVISGDSGEAPRSERPPDPRVSTHPLHYAWAAMMVAATLGAAQLAFRYLQLPDPEMLFLLAIMLTAVWFGRGPTVLAAALSVGCFDFFFVPPQYAFDVADQRYLLTFVTMFGVGLVLSELTLRIKRQERDAVSRAERTAVLYALSRELGAAEAQGDVARVAARHAASVFGARAAVLQNGADGVLSVVACSPSDLQVDAKDLSVAKWALEHAELAGHGTDTLPGARCVCAPLKAAAPVAVLALWPLQAAALDAEQRAFLDLFGRQVAVALERMQLSADARTAALRAKTEEMRSSLLSTVSHDLRTPLASITGAATSLRDDDNLPVDTRRELVRSICDEAVRLERLVSNLLDMTRLDSGAITLKRDWVPVDEIIGSALTRLEERLADRPLELHVPPDLPLLRVDPVLVEQLLINLLENAVKYTPPGSALELRAERQRERMLIEVRDHGPGLSVGSEEKVFDKFYRGAHAGVSGAGLGLPICRGIAEAHGGDIHARNHPDGGAIFSASLPLGESPPSLSQTDQEFS